MKFILLVVGKTVEKHYITAINDYVERTKHYTSFDGENQTLYFVRYGGNPRTEEHQEP